MLRKNPDFIFKEVKGESVLLNPKTGDYFGLNEVGTDFFKLIDGEKDLEQILAELFEIYDVETEILRRDVTELADAMRQKGILL